MPKQLLTRRTVLRGMGTAMALPWLHAMGPSGALASSAAGQAPKRLAFVFVPNGVIQKDWWPSTQGGDFDLPYILEPLAELKSDITVMGGLTCDKARANGDGAGDHARCSAAYLTASQPRKTAGKDIKVGMSIDQFIAQHVGQQTRFPSLELATDRGTNVGSCDSGYSCAYSSNISWRTPETPMAKEVNPRLVFERLFGSEDDRRAVQERAKRNLYKKSILDFVTEDAKKLDGVVGATDKRKIDEYFSSIRDIERRIAHAEQQTESDWVPDYKTPDGIPADFEQHLRLMADMIALAFQGDLTRVTTLMFARAGSNRSYRGIGVSRGHHSISHHRNDQDKVDDLRKIDRYHTVQFAYLINKLKSIREGDATLLDNCMVMYGSGIGDGNRHTHHDLPIIVAGRGGGAVTPGRYVRYEKETPLANLFVSMSNIMGVEANAFGDSTGRIDDLKA